MLPLLSIFLGVIGVFLWQIKRWSDAKPFIDFFVAGGETSDGQTFGFKIINRGQVSAHKLALSVTWHESPVWTHSALHTGKQVYVAVGLNPKVAQRIGGMSWRIDSTPEPLRHSLTHHDISTAYERGWAKLKNGDLLDAAENDNLEVLVTTDFNLRYQQNLASRRIAVVVLSSPSWPRIQRAIGAIVRAVDRSSIGTYIEVVVP